MVKTAWCLGLLAGTSAFALEEGVQSKVFTLETMHIDKPYPAMEGPIQKKSVSLPQDATKGKPVWIKGWSVGLVNKKTGESESLKHLCHAWLTIPKGENEPRSENNLMTISQGMAEMLFPKGYGIRMEDPSKKKIELLVQALNEDASADRWLTPQITVHYVPDEVAEKSGMKALGLKTVSFTKMVRNGKPLPVYEVVEGGKKPFPLDKMMFWVPPGTHTYEMAYPKGTMFQRDGVVHYIKLHLHAHGESMELVDVTENNKVLWKGYGVNETGGTELLKTDSYSSEAGLQVFKDHEYLLRTTYKNVSKKDVDAMAVLRMYWN